MEIRFRIRREGRRIEMGDDEMGDDERWDIEGDVDGDVEGGLILCLIFRDKCV